MENRKIEIFVFHYKPGMLITGFDEYTPVWVGKNLQPEILGLTGDDSGVNISAKNSFYSELTGLYWVWQNTNTDVVGSCHYRRYFTLAREPLLYRLKRISYYAAGIWKKRFGLIYTSNYEYWKGKIITGEEITSLLKQYDAILPCRRMLKYSIEEHYKRYHNIADLALIKSVIKEFYPEYLPAYQKTMAGKRLFANNVFIMPRQHFVKLMEWLFFILFEFEKKIDLQNYQGYQQRIFGFLSERLITVWIEHNQLKYKELPLIYFKNLKNQHQ